MVDEKTKMNGARRACAWEQRKLGELAYEFKSGEFISADRILESGPYPVYGGNGLRGYTTSYNHDDLYALIGRQGALCGNVNIADGKAYFTEHAVAVKANSLNETLFLYYLFDTLNLGQYSGQSAQPGLAVSNLVEVEAMVPTKAEQAQIAHTLSGLDNLITLHQRKYDQLAVLKKALLDKMFPRDGASVPEIRFVGFTDPWEQRKLGDITDRYKELVPTPRDGYTRMGVRSHAKGTFLAEVEPGQQIEEQELSKVRANNLVVNIVFAWEHAVAITSEADAKALVSHRFPQFSFHDDMEPGFFRYATLDEDFRRHLWLASPSGAGRNKTLNIGTMLEYEFIVPSRREQTEIAKFFDRLDNLITLHQRKLGLLKNLKAALLDKMFV